MRRGIVFGTNARGDEFAVVGDGCEGKAVCRWIGYDELYNELGIGGLEKFRYLDGECVISEAFYNEIGDEYAKHMINSLPVIEEGLTYSFKPLGENKGITDVLVTVEFAVKSIALWYGEPYLSGLGFSRVVNFQSVIVLDYSEDESYMPFWKKVGDCVNVHKFLSGLNPLESSETFDNLKRFVEKYEIVEWSGFVPSSPMMSILEYGHIHACRNNPYNGLSFYKKYGTEESVVFRYPLMDHAIIFKNVRGEVMIVSNPYLSDAEITQYMDCLERVSVVSGDYTKLKYDILGKKNHIYGSSNCNMVMFHL